MNENWERKQTSEKIPKTWINLLPHALKFLQILRNHKKRRKKIWIIFLIFFFTFKSFRRCGAAVKIGNLQKATNSFLLSLMTKKAQKQDCSDSLRWKGTTVTFWFSFFDWLFLHSCSNRSIFDRSFTTWAAHQNSGPRKNTSKPSFQFSAERILNWKFRQDKWFTIFFTSSASN